MVFTDHNQDQDHELSDDDYYKRMGAPRTTMRQSFIPPFLDLSREYAELSPKQLQGLGSGIVQSSSVSQGTLFGEDRPHVKDANGPMLYNCDTTVPNQYSYFSQPQDQGVHTAAHPTNYTAHTLSSPSFVGVHPIPQNDMVSQQSYGIIPRRAADTVKYKYDYRPTAQTLFQRATTSRGNEHGEIVPRPEWMPVGDLDEFTYRSDHQSDSHLQNQIVSRYYKLSDTTTEFVMYPNPVLSWFSICRPSVNVYLSDRYEVRACPPETHRGATKKTSSKGKNAAVNRFDRNRLSAIIDRAFLQVVHYSAYAISENSGRSIVSLTEGDLREILPLETICRGAEEMIAPWLGYDVNGVRIVRKGDAGDGEGEGVVFRDEDELKAHLSQSGGTSVVFHLPSHSGSNVYGYP